MNKKKLIFILIILLGFFLRFYNLSNVPPSVSLDEASIGYNAYSILQTGKDEYGIKFPILLRAYDDWRPALYVYLVIPFVKIFGLNILAIRLPSILLSMASVIATYFLACELIQISKARINATMTGFIASFLLTISPWHIYISRLGHEANAGLAFFIFAFLFFLKQRIYFSFIFFALSFISYQAEKIFIPLFIAILFILFRRELWKLKRKVIFASLLALIILIPFVKETLLPNALIRVQATSAFNANQELFYKEAILFQRAAYTNDLIGKIVHNRRIVDLRIVTQGYFSHFNPRWLFSNSSDDRHKVPGLGLLYVWELPLIIFGIAALIIKHFDKKSKTLIFLWILITPLASAFTTDTPHAMRSYTFLPSFQILSALGFVLFFDIFKKKIIQRTVVIVFLIIVGVSLIYFYKQYYIVFPKTQSSSFQYALPKAIPFISQNEKTYSKIVFSNQDNLYQSYMFFLFYTKYDPIIYQKQGGTKSGGFAKSHKIGKYEFRPIDYPNEKKGTLLVGNISDFPKETYSLKAFTNLDGKETIKVVVR